ncbi:unnamed protein product [Eretmochelys imbricata]
MSDPVLRAPDFDKPFLVTTDASERGVGAVLMQEGQNLDFHPVIFLSKKLSERESHWAINEKECYAIVYTLEKLRPYVWGQCFHLQTDHAVLQWLHTTKGNNKKLIWWSLALQDFDFDIQHISGASNKWLMHSPMKVSQNQLVKIILEMWKILLVFIQLVVYLEVHVSY